jgi:hypothetical protein
MRIDGRPDATRIVAYVVIGLLLLLWLLAYVMEGMQ